MNTPPARGSFEPLTETPVTAALPAGADRCFQLFNDAQLLKLWVPGLRRVQVVRSREDGLPLEVKYDYDESRSYSLLYDYDPGARRVAWTPGLGSRDAVQGCVTFEDEAGGCRMTYQLRPGSGRSAREREQSSAERVVAAFAEFVRSLR